MVAHTIVVRAVAGSNPVIQVLNNVKNCQNIMNDKRNTLHDILTPITQT